MKHTVRTYGRNLRSSSRRRSSTPSKSTSFSSFLKRMLKSLLFTLLCGLLLILIFSLGVYFYPDPDTLIPNVTISEAEALRREGVISGGMIPKVDCCIDAIDHGVENVIIMDGRISHSILMELLTDEGAGTMVKGDGK